VNRLIALIIVTILCGESDARVWAASNDTYEPLTLYDGKWRLHSNGGRTTVIANHCVRAGLFFICEQTVKDAADTLLVFVPRGKADGGETYGTQVLLADTTMPGPWGTLTIRGDDWIYAPQGNTPHDRTLNHFYGRDHIHFDVQKSLDGKTWKSVLSGDESRMR